MCDCSGYKRTINLDRLIIEFWFTVWTRLKSFSPVLSAPFDDTVANHGVCVIATKCRSDFCKLLEGNDSLKKTEGMQGATVSWVLARCVRVAAAVVLLFVKIGSYYDREQHWRLVPPQMFLFLLVCFFKFIFYTQLEFLERHVGSVVACC